MSQLAFDQTKSWLVSWATTFSLSPYEKMLDNCIYLLLARAGRFACEHRQPVTFGEVMIRL